MATILEHNVTTGETVERDETAAEKKQREADAKADAEIAAAAEAAAAKKAAILAALAEATGYTADELRDALNA